MLKPVSGIDPTIVIWRELLPSHKVIGPRKYVILGACNPPLAHQALTSELEIGLLLPCNVMVYEDNGGSVVSIVDPMSMLGAVENPGLDPVADEARTRLQRVIKSLAGE